MAWWARYSEDRDMKAITLKFHLSFLLIQNLYLCPPSCSSSSSSLLSPSSFILCCTHEVSQTRWRLQTLILCHLLLLSIFRLAHICLRRISLENRANLNVMPCNAGIETCRLHTLTWNWSCSLSLFASIRFPPISISQASVIFTSSEILGILLLICIYCYMCLPVGDFGFLLNMCIVQCAMCLDPCVWT